MIFSPFVGIDFATPLQPIYSMEKISTCSLYVIPVCLLWYIGSHCMGYNISIGVFRPFCKQAYFSYLSQSGTYI
jgi:hypothetical protein